MVDVPNCELETPAYGTGTWAYGPNPTGGSTTFTPAMWTPIVAHVVPARSGLRPRLVPAEGGADPLPDRPVNADTAVNHIRHALGVLVDGTERSLRHEDEPAGALDRARNEPAEPRTSRAQTEGEIGFLRRVVDTPCHLSAPPSLPPLPQT